MQIIKDHTNLDMTPSNLDNVISGNDTLHEDDIKSNNSTSAAIPVPEKSSPGQSSRNGETPSLGCKHSVTEKPSENGTNENIDGFKQNEMDSFNVEPFFSPILHQSIDIKDSAYATKKNQTKSFNHSNLSMSTTGLRSITPESHSRKRLSSPLQKPKISYVSKASSGYASFCGGLSSSKSCPSLFSCEEHFSAEGKWQSGQKVPGFRSQNPPRFDQIWHATSYSDLEESGESGNEAMCMSDPQKLHQNCRVKENDNNRPICRHHCGVCCKDFSDIRDARLDSSSVDTSDASTSPHLPIGQIWKNGVTSAEQCQCVQGRINPVTAERIGPQRRKGHSYEYDAFLDYNIQDEKWALDLLKILEGPKYNFSIYLHERDKVLGRHTIDEIANQLQNCFKYICLLSPHFLNSSEMMENLHLAQHERTSNRPFSNYVILLKIAAPCEIPLSLKSLEWEDCTRVACKDGPDRYVVDKVVKAMRDIT